VLIWPFHSVFSLSFVYITIALYYDSVNYSVQNRSAKVPKDALPAVAPKDALQAEAQAGVGAVAGVCPGLTSVACRIFFNFDHFV